MSAVCQHLAALTELKIDAKRVCPECLALGD